MIGQGVPNIVVASNRIESMITFIDSWKNFLKGCNLIIVWDFETIPESTITPEGFTLEQYSWREIDLDLQEKSWIIPRKTSGIKSFGFYKAWQNKPLFIYTLDDDVYPPLDETNPIVTHYNNLFNPRNTPRASWLSTTKNFLPRGTVGAPANVVISHGLWVNVPDYSGKTQATHEYPKIGTDDEYNAFTVPKNVFISMCGMNLAFKPIVAKWMYFGIQGFLKINDSFIKMPTRRTDDILAGMYVKKKIDNECMSMYSGAPYCHHSRASNTWTNLRDESNDEQIIIEYEELLNTNSNSGAFGSYFDMLADARSIWEGLFNE